MCLGYHEKRKENIGMKIIISLMKKYKNYRLKNKYKKEMKKFLKQKKKFIKQRDKYLQKKRKFLKYKRTIRRTQVKKDYIYIKKIIGLFKIRFTRIILHVFYIFPVKKNKIVFICYEGRQYACNPRKISQYLVEKYGDDLDIVWVFNKVPKNLDLEKEGIRTVKYGTKKYLKEALTAKVFLSNMRIVENMPFRKSQVRISTGHGGGAYKHLLLDIPGLTKKDVKKIKMASDNTSIFVSTNRRYSDLVIRGAYGAKCEILECGMPRNDVLFDKEIMQSQTTVRDYYDIPSTTKILLYAPTYRQGRSFTDYQLDNRVVLEALEQRFGGDWILLYRLHHFIKGEWGFGLAKKRIIDATSYRDMQELLIESDILITDYSSSIWDFSLTGKPGFLYAPDVLSYTHNQGFYTEIEDWPFYLASTNDELIRKICDFDEEEYKNRVEKHHRELGITEQGHATEIISERIYKECRG